MFEILNDPYVKTMLELSGEHVPVTQLKEDVKKLNIEKLFELCAEHELEGTAASNIIKYDIFTLPSYWQDAYNKQLERLSFLKEKSAEICKAMDKNGIKMVILKNGGIMADIIDDPAACPMEDIDSLVKKSDFMCAHDILVKNGFTFKFRSEFEFEKLERAFRDGSTEYYITMPDREKMWFELAWRPVAGRWIRLDKEPDADLLVDRAYYSKDTKVGILSPEDNLLQVCVHTAKHSYVRAPGLRLHLDVERIVTHKEIDWDVFLKAVNDTHVKTAVYFSLLIPRVLFGTQIPEWVLDKLHPGKLKEKKVLKLLGSAGLLHPKDRKFSKFKFLKFQTLLYDSFGDMLKVLNPGLKTMREIYGFKYSLLMPYYICLRGFDLAGIRKKKRD